MMESNAKVPEIYAGMVFNDKVMRERLPKDVYKARTAHTWNWMWQIQLPQQ